MRLRATAALCLTLLTEPLAAETFVQRHDPDKCEGSVPCLREWFAEYKAAMVAEYLSYRAFEETAAKILWDGDQRTAGHARNEAEASDPVRQTFKQARDPAVIDAASQAERDAIWECRFAAITMHSLLAQAALQEFARARADRNEYVPAARACEHGFQIKPLRSKLRDDDFDAGR